jgi:uncharacterized membrane protein/uncharacterized membrane protein YeaQ/YmgE (transglycosylase-associated protein family)
MFCTARYHGRAAARGRRVSLQEDRVRQLLTWTVTGLGAGWFVLTVMRSRREFGVVGDLVMGCLGAIVGGWLFRRLGILAPDHIGGQVVVALVGATALLASVRALRSAMQVTGVGNVAATAVAATTGDLEDRLKRLGTLERNIVQAWLSRQVRSRDPNLTFDAQSTFGQRVADKVALVGGSWAFIGVFGIILVAWMAMNQEMDRPFDPFPYILLNLVLSCLAALQAPVIMMSQNRQALKDRSDARTDYEVNVRAEMEILSLHTKLDLLREEDWRRLSSAIEQQQASLAAIERRLEVLAPAGPPR